LASFLRESIREGRGNSKSNKPVATKSKKVPQAKVSMKRFLRDNGLSLVLRSRNGEGPVDAPGSTYARSDLLIKQGMRSHVSDTRLTAMGWVFWMRQEHQCDTNIIIDHLRFRETCRDPFEV
jgi:hypothetical protein